MVEVPLLLTIIITTHGNLLLHLLAELLDLLLLLVVLIIELGQDAVDALFITLAFLCDGSEFLVGTNLNLEVFS